MSVWRVGTRTAFAAVAVLVAMVFGAVSASAETVEFKPSAEQSFEVPAGVTQVEVLAVGGAGEDGFGDLGCESPGAPGGSGAKVTATVPVGAGETLKVRFGGGGAQGALGCGAGNGGGRSEVLTASPLVVAGGGGGAGGSDGGAGAFGGGGGSAEALVGDNGEDGNNINPGEGGEGGGLSEGKGGTAGFGCVAGFAGVGETGGEGAGANFYCASGGGGGGGYKGGGGGGGGGYGGGGGGAGSSYIAPSATGEVASGASEAQRVLITYTVTETVQERLENLLADVTGVGPGTRFANKVKAIQRYAAKPRKRAACARLAGFIKFVNHETGKKITKGQAESFIKQAEEIRAALGC